MPRGRLSKNGPALAQYGYDVDTAPPTKMRFSPDMVAMRLALTGTVVCGSHGDGPPYTDYAKATIVYDTAFPEPPIVRVAGINGDGTSDQSPYVITYAGSGEQWMLPHYVVYSYASYFDLYVLRWNNYYVGPLTWRYFVFHNTLSG